MDDLDREWQAEQGTFRYQLDLLHTQANDLGRLIVAALPSWTPAWIFRTVRSRLVK